jgi:hypothetical protein
MAAVGILNFRNNAQIDQASADKARAANDAAAATAAQVTDRLALHCWSEFERAREAKMEVQELMLQDMRARNSEYDPEVLQLIEEGGGGSRIFMPIPQEKVAAAVSTLYDIYLNDRPYQLQASPIPDIPPEYQARIQQQAQVELEQAGPLYAQNQNELRKRVEQMKDDMLQRARQWAMQRAQHNEDQVEEALVKGGFYDAFKGALDDGMGLRGGIIKGPEVKRLKRLEWAKNGRDVVVSNEPTRTYKACSPLDIFPGPGLGDFNSGPISERDRWTPEELYDAIGLDGFREDEIRKTIDQYGTKGYQNWWWSDTERARLEGRPVQWLSTPEGLYDVIIHHTKVTGKLLADWGVPKHEVPDGERLYSVTCWMLSPSVVFGCRLNEHPLGHRPYFKFGFRKVRGSFWYQSVQAVIRPIMLMCNAAARSLANNMAMAAGYQREVQVDRMPPGAPIEAQRPFSTTQTTSPRNGSAGPAIYLHQPELNGQQYMQVFEFFSSLADVMLGLPSFLSGSPGVAGNMGAQGTSSGLAQYREMATRTFKYTVKDVDDALEGVVDETHTDIVLTGKQDPMLTGDLDVKAKGSTSLANRTQQAVRINELLQATANPFDQAIMGPIAGRAELLRAAMKGLEGIDVDRAVPSRDMLLTQMRAAMAQSLGLNPDGSPQAQPGGPAAPGGPPAAPPPGLQPPRPRATMPDGSVSGDGNLT